VSGALLITGASTGIGEACAKHFSTHGYSVYAGVRRISDAERLRAEIGGHLEPVILDVTAAETIAAARDFIADREGDRGLAGLINNAGIAVSAPMECVPLEEFRHQYEVNVFGALAVTQTFLPMLRRARGRIIMMSSVSGRMTLPFLGPYSSSKFALEALSDALRMELRRWGVAVSIIEPGPIATPIWDKSRHVAMHIRDSLPATFQALYGDMLARFRQIMSNAARGAVPVDVVVEVVEEALTVLVPKARYPVGHHARLSIFLNRFYSDRMRDRFLLRDLSL
jgi:NAD(P)-dependent dehydrogenase (short-subunit alcohol dehydrogenase family)